MKAAVRYYTRSGNTQKLAEQIARTVGVEAKTVQEKLTEDVDILFLGSSVYAAGEIHRETGEKTSEGEGNPHGRLDAKDLKNVADFAGEIMKAK